MVKRQNLFKEKEKKKLRMTRYSLFAFVVFFLCTLTCSSLFVSASAIHTEPNTNDSKKKVLVIGIDGCRADVFDKYTFSSDSLGVFHLLAKIGKATRCESNDATTCARAHDGPQFDPDSHWCTAPGWASVVSGLNLQNHHVVGNSEQQQSVFSKVTERYPTFLKLAKDHGYSVAATGAPNFISYTDIGDMGIIDYECGADASNHYMPFVKGTQKKSCNLDHRLAQNPHDEERDQNSFRFTERNIRQGVDVNMIHFDLVDHMGHTYGFGYNEHYVGQLKLTEFAVGKLLTAINRRLVEQKFIEEWLIMLTADHGGHEKSHDKDPVNDKAVPFLVAIVKAEKEQRVHEGENDLMVDLKFPVRHFDVQPTVVSWLGIDDKSHRDGTVQGLPLSYHRPQDVVSPVENVEKDSFGDLVKTFMSSSLFHLLRSTFGL